MQLLVSVRSAEEAMAAAAGGADLIDAKEPSAGALGAVSIDVLRAIVGVAAGSHPITAALGDATDEDAVERQAAAFAAAGATLVKVGFAGVRDRRRVDAMLAAAARGAGRDRVIAVAYADWFRVKAISQDDLLEAAVDARVAGVLIDTADKAGAGLLELIDRRTLMSWVERAKRAGLLVALAGKLTETDLAAIRDISADVVGVRGAACEHGRNGRVGIEAVRRLRTRFVEPVYTAGVSAGRDR